MRMCFCKKGKVLLRQFIQSKPLKKEILGVSLIKKKLNLFFDKVLSFGQYPVGTTKFLMQQVKN